MSSASARTQSAPWAAPSSCEATISSPTPIPVLIASPRTDWRSFSSSRLAITNRPIWQYRTTP